LNCKEEKYSVRDFVTIVFIRVRQWRLDHETGLSTAHLGIQDRDLAYEEKCNCSRHIVYWLVKRGKVG
jgi:hypothetical protein